MPPMHDSAYQTDFFPWRALRSLYAKMRPPLARSSIVRLFRPRALRGAYVVPIMLLLCPSCASNVQDASDALATQTRLLLGPATVSDDGSQVAMSGIGGEIGVWSANTGRLRCRVIGIHGAARVELNAAGSILFVSARPSSAAPAAAPEDAQVLLFLHARDLTRAGRVFAGNGPPVSCWVSSRVVAHSRYRSGGADGQSELVFSEVVNSGLREIASFESNE